MGPAHGQAGGDRHPAARRRAGLPLHPRGQQQGLPGGWPIRGGAGGPGLQCRGSQPDRGVNAHLHPGLPGGRPGQHQRHRRHRSRLRPAGDPPAHPPQRGGEHPQRHRAGSLDHQLQPGPPRDRPARGDRHHRHHRLRRALAPGSPADAGRGQCHRRHQPGDAPVRAPDLTERLPHQLRAQRLRGGCGHLPQHPLRSAGGHPGSIRRRWRRDPLSRLPRHAQRQRERGAPPGLPSLSALRPPLSPAAEPHQTGSNT